MTTFLTFAFRSKCRVNKTTSCKKKDRWKTNTPLGVVIKTKKRPIISPDITVRLLIIKLRYCLDFCALTSLRSAMLPDRVLLNALRTSRVEIICCPDIFDIAPGCQPGKFGYSVLRHSRNVIKFSKIVISSEIWLIEEYLLLLTLR